MSKRLQSEIRKLRTSVDKFTQKMVIKLDILEAEIKHLPVETIEVDPDDKVPNTVLVREQFLKCYEVGYKRPYPGWGARENTQAKRWLQSCPLQKALALCRFYLSWKDRFAVKMAHPFGLLVARWVEVDAWLLDSQGQMYRAAEARAVENLINKEVEERINVRRHAIKAGYVDGISLTGGDKVSLETQLRIPGASDGVFGSDDDPWGSQEDA